MDLTNIAATANMYKQKAEEGLRPMLVKTADGLVKLQLFLQLLMEKFRNIDVKEFWLFVLSIFGLGLSAGVRMPRRCRKWKVVLLLASVAGIIVFLYKLLTKED